MKAVITTILLGLSSTAIADSTPYNQFDRDHRYDERLDGDRFDGNRFDGNRADDRYDGRWMRFRRPVVLASNVSMMRMWNRDQRPLLIDIDSRTGGLRKIRLDHNMGRMHVDSVTLVFADGRRQHMAVNQVLSQRNPSITLDLEGRGITALAINGATMRGRAMFDVIGLRR
jgi:hypothetical protein